jgi:hypothetical protein
MKATYVGTVCLIVGIIAVASNISSMTLYNITVNLGPILFYFSVGFIGFLLICIGGFTLFLKFVQWEWAWYHDSKLKKKR